MSSAVMAASVPVVSNAGRMQHALASILKVGEQGGVRASLVIVAVIISVLAGSGGTWVGVGQMVIQALRLVLCTAAAGAAVAAVATSTRHSPGCTAESGAWVALAIVAVLLSIAAGGSISQGELLVAEALGLALCVRHPPQFLGCLCSALHVMCVYVCKRRLRVCVLHVLYRKLCCLCLSCLPC